MNIFFFTKDVNLNSRLLDDKRLVKMVLETTQLLSNGLFLNNCRSPYNPTHLKHPCSIWAAKSCGNWKWLRLYGLALAKEYTRRFGKIHKCEKLIRLMKCPKSKNIKFTNPPQCMPIQYKNKRTDIAYINYYINEKFNPKYFRRTDKCIFDLWKKLVKIGKNIK